MLLHHIYNAITCTAYIHKMSIYFCQNSLKGSFVNIKYQSTDNVSRLWHAMQYYKSQATFSGK